jgi:hypothetical protein
MGRKGEAPLTYGQTSKAKYCRLPEPPKGAHVQAGGAVTHAVAQVNSRRLVEVALREIQPAQPSGDQAVYRRA